MCDLGNKTSTAPILLELEKSKLSVAWIWSVISSLSQNLRWDLELKSLWSLKSQRGKKAEIEQFGAVLESQEYDFF